MVSAVVLAKNNTQSLMKTLQSLQWCDERIVLDDESEESIEDVAILYNARYIKRKVDGDFSKQRNFGLEKAKYDWVLFIDSDEIVSLELQQEIRFTLNKKRQDINGYKIERRDSMWGRELKHGEWGNQSLIRLGRKSAGVWSGSVHERWRIDDNVFPLQSAILHFPHQTIASFLGKIQFYTDIRSEELFRQKKKTNVFEIILYPIGKFFQNFIFRLGIRDGIPGLIISLLMSFHSFLVRAKLFMLWQNKRKKD